MLLVDSRHAGTTDLPCALSQIDADHAPLDVAEHGTYKELVDSARLQTAETDTDTTVFLPSMLVAMYQVTE